MADLHLTPKEVRLFKKLNTPQKIQNFLDSLPANFEKKGETHRSPREMLKARKAHCIEGALFAAAVLWYHRAEPLIMDLQSAPGDDDHVLALYRFNGYWGAISKSNHATIRYRDPVYRSTRELVMSYFHEWFPESTGKRTLRSYSKALNLKKFGTDWVTSPKHLWWIDKELNAQPHYDIAPRRNIKVLRTADKMEIISGSLTEWRRSDHRT